MEEHLTEEMREEIKQIIEENNKVLISALNATLMEFGNNQLKLMNEKLNGVDSKFEGLNSKMDKIINHFGIGNSNTTVL
jgi:hypothetical protein